MHDKLMKVGFLGFVGVVMAGLIVFGVLATSAHAQQMPKQMQGPLQPVGGHFGPGPARIPGVFGKVTAISGTNLTITSMGRFNASTTHTGFTNTSTTYSVDASNAIVLKGGSSSTFSAIAVGDTVMVQGIVTGDSVVATRIIDGVEPGIMMMHGGRGGMIGFGSSTRPSGTWPYNASGSWQGASGTFPGGWRGGYPSSTASSTDGSGGGQPPQPHHGFFAPIMNFFGSIFGHFRF